jgi:AcrR family transcriptional regulator
VSQVQKTRKPRSSRRAPLTRERVLRAAIAHADERGAEELTMRKLAKVLGVEAMSLYNHVANKDDPGGEWKEELRKRALSTRAALARHPWAIGEMEGRTSHGPSNMRLHDAVLGCLRAAGFSLDMTVHAYSVQDAYIYGFALQETDMSSETPADFAAEAQRQMRDYEAVLGHYPHLVEVVGGHVAKAGYDYTTEFLFGLNLILDALERLLPRHQETTI